MDKIQLLENVSYDKVAEKIKTDFDELKNINMI